MCGIAGFVNLGRPLPPEEMTAVARRMTDCLLHRGPDAGDVWVDAAAQVALGHRRLAIIDLSSEGHQPMHSADGRYVIAFNGEIYNYAEIRGELRRLGQQFRGGSDTEVMLAAFCEWGFDQALRRFNGMFSFALWDRAERRLRFARDRMGEKPLYYGWAGDTLVFASELKAIRSYPGFSPRINRNALALFMRHNYVPGPFSIYEGVWKLPAATNLMLEAGTKTDPRPRTYWSAIEAASQGVRAPIPGRAEEALDHLEVLLKDAVKLRMQADVPLGAFLSGGVDSSTVVALMQSQSARPVRTFTIGFKEHEYNEAEHAKAVARHLGTEHTELYLTSKDALDVIPRLPALYDEPFADSSQIPTFLVAQLARRHVTVSLSGDGGDELFGGYTRYTLGNAIWKRLRWFPGAGRSGIARLINGVKPGRWERLYAAGSWLLPRSLRFSNPSDKLQKLTELLQVKSGEELYRQLVSHWKEPSSLVLGSEEPSTALSDASAAEPLPTLTEKMMLLDSISYLPDDILVKVDRASMGVSLEARVPLLDHRVYELAWRMPIGWKVKGTISKWPLRQILYRHVPRELIERPKMGFGVPIDAWLRGPLRGWAQDLLSDQKLSREGYLDPRPIGKKMREHLSGERNWQYYLWDVLMFEAWLATAGT